MPIQRIVVLGDSVPWGQGLSDPHKYSSLVSKGLPGPHQPTVEMYAHSGAVIDLAGTLGDQVDQCDRRSHEIPVPSPTVRSQVRSVPEPETADLILVNGGINDVSVYRILNPLTRTEDLFRYIQEACYAGMKLLLTEAAMVFKNPESQIIVTGYYPFLSSKSDQSLIEDLVNVFGIHLPDHLNSDLLLQQVTRLSMQFWKESDAALAQAVVDSAVPAPHGPKMIFLPGSLQEENAIFAPNPWLFGLANGINPEDEVAAPRASACDGCYQDPLQLMQHEACRLASAGHPNLIGAQQYAASILAACAQP